MPNNKITLDMMRAVVEQVEQKMQQMEAQFKQINQRISRIEQTMHFGDI